MVTIRYDQWVNYDLWLVISTRYSVIQFIFYTQITLTYSMHYYSHQYNVIVRFTKYSSFKNNTLHLGGFTPSWLELFQD